MGVRQLHSNASSLVLKRISEIDSEIREMNKQRLSLEMRGAIIPQVVFDSIDGMRYLRDEFKRFLKMEVWQTSEDVPYTIDLHGAPEPSTTVMKEAIEKGDGTKTLFGRHVDGTILLYRNAFYSVSGPYDSDEARMIFKDWYERKRKKIAALNSGNDEDLKSLRRSRIAETVRHEVWRRDQGKCVECGSNENLEFDHIIPVSRGGSNTVRNIQLLCESCNRRKSDSIG